MATITIKQAQKMMEPVDIGIILSGVMQELSAFMDQLDNYRAGQEYLKNQDKIQKEILNTLLGVLGGSSTVSKKLVGGNNKARDTLLAFMQHWASAAVKKYCKLDLPSAYSNGKPNSLSYASVGRTTELSKVNQKELATSIAKRLQGNKVTAKLDVEKFKAGCAEIAEMTDENDHQGARIKGAQLLMDSGFNSSKYIKLYKGLKVLHEAEDEFPMELAKYRSNVDKRFFKYAEQSLKSNPELYQLLEDAY